MTIDEWVPADSRFEKIVSERKINRQLRHNDEISSAYTDVELLRMREAHEPKRQRVRPTVEEWMNMLDRKVSDETKKAFRDMVEHHNKLNDIDQRSDTPADLPATGARPTLTPDQLSAHDALRTAGLELKAAQATVTAKQQAFREALERWMTVNAGTP